jgi:hypothetical protein
MTRAGTRAFRTTDARRVGEILRPLSAQWQTPALAGINVTLNPRLSRTLGRLVGRQWRIELGPRAIVSSKRLREVVTHEGAHAVLAMALDARTLPHDVRRTKRVAGWAYAQAEQGGATVWQRGRDGLIDLDPRWRGLLLP